MNTNEESYGIMKRSLEVLIEKLDSLKEDEPYWSTQIDAIRNQIIEGDIEPEGPAVLELRTLETEADGAPQNSKGMSSSKKVKDIQVYLYDYRNAFANYHHHT